MAAPCDKSCVHARTRRRGGSACLQAGRDELDEYCAAHGPIPAWKGDSDRVRSFFCWEAAPDLAGEPCPACQSLNWQQLVQRSRLAQERVAAGQGHGVPAARCGTLELQARLAACATRCTEAVAELHGARGQLGRLQQELDQLREVVAAEQAAGTLGPAHIAGLLEQAASQYGEGGFAITRG